MDYELAKELKEAKFPKSKDWVEHSTLMKGNYFMVDGYGVPNLSELIEACGEDFDRLILRSPTINPFWEAYNLKDERERGKSPEEAVAKLWLVINKK